MKLLKIGSSSSSNIVLNSEFVSSHHAEILLLDSGEIILEDKNSTNGTFVGGKKITPNKEVTIQRGDYVKFADVELQWSRVPALENTSKYKSILNIGTNFRNDPGYFRCLCQPFSCYVQGGKRRKVLSDGFGK